MLGSGLENSDNQDLVRNPGSKEPGFLFGSRASGASGSDRGWTAGRAAIHGPALSGEPGNRSPEIAKIAGELFYPTSHRLRIATAAS